MNEGRSKERSENYTINGRHVKRMEETRKAEFWSRIVKGAIVLKTWKEMER
jgi:hypothetical protein